MVIDYSDETGMEGVYVGSYDDCVAYLEEQGNSCFAMDIVLNPYFKG